MDRLEQELDRAKQYETDNKKLRDQKREDDFQISLLTDKMKDTETCNEDLRLKLQDQDAMINKFSEEVRNLDVAI